MAEGEQVAGAFGESRSYATEAVAFLTNQRSGTLLQDFGEDLAALVEAVRETGRGGELTLKVKIRPAAKNGGPSVVVSDAIALKAPKPEIAETVMYAGDGGVLSRRDPRQPSLPGGFS